MEFFHDKRVTHVAGLDPVCGCLTPADAINAIYSSRYSWDLSMSYTIH